jgi:hypothetical protein
MRGAARSDASCLIRGLLISRSDVSGHQNPAILDQLGQAH